MSLEKDETEVRHSGAQGASADVVFGLLLLASSIFALAWIQLATPRGIVATTGALDFSSFPTLCSTLLIVLSSIYLGGSVLRLMAERRLPRSVARPDAPLRLGPTGWRRIGTVSLLVAYVFALKSLPFFVATTFFLALGFVLYGHRSPVAVLGVSISGGGLLTALFVYALRLPI